MSEEQLKALRTETRALVESLPGPLRRIVVRNADHVVEVEWSQPVGAAPVAAPPATPEVVADSSETVVLSPLVGTFYAAPQPGAAPFVAVGDVVESGQTVAIVEAMKLMNHVVAERAGRVTEVLVGDGEPVEFAQPLMRMTEAAAEGGDE
jgi:acetyl-CoA carboxylase biotin carboxyl carrier protein